MEKGSRQSKSAPSYSAQHIQNDSWDTLRESHHQPQHWHGGLENGETSVGGYRTRNRKDCLPSFSATCNKMSAKVHPSLHPTTGRHQSFSLPLNPLGHVGRLWDLWLQWNQRAEIHPTPSQRRNTLNHSVSSCFWLLSVALMTPARPIHLVCESECTGGKRGWKRGLPKDKLWVLNWKGLWEVSHRRHHHHCKKKYVPKKKVSCFVKTQLWLQNCCREKTCFFFFSFFTLLQRYCLSTRHHWSLWAGGRVHVHKNHCSKTL